MACENQLNEEHLEIARGVEFLSCVAKKVTSGIDFQVCLLGMLPASSDNMAADGSMSHMKLGPDKCRHHSFM